MCKYLDTACDESSPNLSHLSSFIDWRGGDGPDVVEGAPGGLLPGHRLVPPRAVANTDLRQEMQTNERQNCGFRAALLRGLLGVLKCEDCGQISYEP